MTLSEALEQVDLEPGKTYHCQVQGLSVQLEVRPASKAAFLPDPVDFSEANQIPATAWCDLPGPERGRRVKVRPGGDFTPEFFEITDDQLAPE